MENFTNILERELKESKKSLTPSEQAYLNSELQKLSAIGADYKLSPEEKIEKINKFHNDLKEDGYNSKK